MKRIVFPILALATATSAMAQIKETWSNTLSDPMTHYESRDVTVSPKGVTFSISKYSGALCRVNAYDGLGNRLWTTQLPVLSTEGIMKIESDAEGAPTATVLSDDHKVNVIKLNPTTGAVQWHAPIDEVDDLVDLDIDVQGNIIVTFQSRLDTCVYVSKLNPLGSPLFKTLSGLPGHPATMTAVAANGQIYVGLNDKVKQNGIMALTPNGTVRYIKSWDSFKGSGGSFELMKSFVVSDRNGRAFAVDTDPDAEGGLNIRTFDSTGSSSVQNFPNPNQFFPSVCIDSENRIVVVQFTYTGWNGFAITWFSTSSSGVARTATGKIEIPEVWGWGMKGIFSDSFGQTYLHGSYQSGTDPNRLSAIWALEPGRTSEIWKTTYTSANAERMGAAAIGRWGQLAMTTTHTNGKLYESILGVKQMGFRNMLINGSSHTGGRTITGTANFYSSSDATRNVALLSNTPYATVGAPTTTVVAGQSQSVFSVDLKPTAVRRAVRIDGTYNGTTRSVVFYLEPPVAASVTLYPLSVKGGMKANATARLNGDAPAGGINVAITSNNPSATVPAALTIPEGDISKGFQVNTTTVSQATTATISATANNVTKTATLTITP